MYLHIGNQKNIREKDIIGIFDADRTTTSWVTRKYLSEAQRRDLVRAANQEIPKSLSCTGMRSAGSTRCTFPSSLPPPWWVAPAGEQSGTSERNDHKNGGYRSKKYGGRGI